MNVAGPAGRELFGRWGLEVVPTFLVFRDGREVYRATGLPDRERFLAALGS